jgi:UDP-N-acetylmuramyl pentapeptide phosphotransferase/UDP-N-acetylglucosamine-1-phosphate transferase
MTVVSYYALLAAVLVGAGVAGILVLTQRWHGRFSLDHDLNGAQKFHEVPVPRVGGLAFVAGLLAAMFVMADEEGGAWYQMLLLLLAGIPAFAAGLFEDMTKSVSVRFRLVATFLSAALAIWLLDATLTRTNTFGLDELLAYLPFAMLFTCFAVAGVANAVNIIDGFNGLASGSVVIMLLGMAGLSWISQDTMMLTFCLAGAAALLGFMLLNFPFGKIFLGDGGAYLAGFWLAECAVLLVARNPDLSGWSVLLCCIYPIWETVFSMWRKSIYRKTGMGRPDKVHFHMLVFRRMVGQQVGKATAPWVRHGLTSLFIWMLVSCCQVFAIGLALFDEQNWTPMLAVAAFASLYGFIYRRLVFRTAEDETKSIDEMRLNQS